MMSTEKENGKNTNTEIGKTSSDHKTSRIKIMTPIRINKNKPHKSNEQQENNGSRFANLLTQNSIENFNKIKNSYECLGEDLFFAAVNNKKYKIRYTNLVLSAISDFSVSLCFSEQIDQKIADAIEKQPELNNKLLFDLFDEYGYTFSDLFLKNIQETDVFSDIPNILERAKQSDAEKYIILAKEIDQFIDCVNTDIVDLLRKMIQRINNEDKTGSKELAIRLKQEGHSLEEIGKTLGVTRERVRQILTGAKTKLSHMIHLSNMNPVGYVRARTEDKFFLNKDDFAFVFQDGQVTDWLWSCLSGSYFDCKKYSYSSIFDAMIFVDVTEITQVKINQTINRLPKIIEENDLENILLRESENLCISKDLMFRIFRKIYTKSNKVYVRGTLTNTAAYSYILARYFPEGIKARDPESFYKFSSLVSEKFGTYMADFDERTLYIYVSRFGVLCGIGKYMAPSLLNIDKDVLGTVDEYISQNERTAISFAKIFKDLEEKLMAAGITNQYFLHGVLKYYNELSEEKKEYIICRDYVTKDCNVTKKEEISKFIAENSPVHSSVIRENFPELYPEIFPQVIKRIPEIQSVGNGYYVHDSYFDDKNEADIEKELKALRKKSARSDLHRKNNYLEKPRNISFIVSSADYFEISKKAEKKGLSLSEYIRNVTINSD